MDHINKRLNQSRVQPFALYAANAPQGAAFVVYHRKNGGINETISIYRS